MTSQIFDTFDLLALELEFPIYHIYFILYWSVNISELLFATPCSEVEFMTAYGEIVIWLDTRIWRVTIHGQLSLNSIRLYFKYRQIWESSIKTDLEIVSCVLD
jgi:hypothetical protein